MEVYNRNGYCSHIWSCMHFQCWLGFFFSICLCVSIVTKWLRIQRHCILGFACMCLERESTVTESKRSGVGKRSMQCFNQTCMLVSAAHFELKIAYSAAWVKKCVAFWVIFAARWIACISLSSYSAPQAIQNARHMYSSRSTVHAWVEYILFRLRLRSLSASIEYIGCACVCVNWQYATVKKRKRLYAKAALNVYTRLPNQSL